MLTEHVAYADDKHVKDSLFARNTGRDIEALSKTPGALDQFIRQQAFLWLDDCTHFIGVVNVPSWGVGMEIERCLSRPQRNLPPAKMLLLRSVELDATARLSPVITGINSTEFPFCQLFRYSDEAEVLQTIESFLAA